MHIDHQTRTIFLSFSILVIFCLASIESAHAAVDTAKFTQQAPSTMIADDQCKEYTGNCSYEQVCNVRKPKTRENTGIVGKICTDPHGVTGHCVKYGVCHADTAAAAPGSTGSGSGIGDLSSLMGAISKMLGALGGGGGGGSGGGSPTGCTQYYQVSTPSSDPCAYYVPPDNVTPVNIDLGSGSQSDPSSNNPASDLFRDLSGNDNTSDTNNSNTSSADATANASGSINPSTSSTSARTAGGAQGDIRVLPNGATIVVTNEGGGGNSVVAGFVGSNASGGAQPQGIVAKWCRTRPWATNFLSYIVPPVFFDSLCSARGYRVGEVAPAPAATQQQLNVQLTQKKTQTKPVSTTTPIQEPPPSPPMTVDIWAVPPAVPLGTRTNIFWTSKNAATCTETSPDGSFSHNTLSGGGATVPLAGPTTFTISCIAPDGAHATDYVTVNLSI
jgi:hypothetical protein